MFSVLGIVYSLHGVSKYPILIIDDYEYSVDKRVNGLLSYGCRWRRKYGCLARLVLDNGGVIQVISFKHTHDSTFKGNYLDCQVEIAKFLYRDSK